VWGVQAGFEVPFRAVAGVVLRAGECVEVLNRDPGLDRSRAGERVLISCSVGLFGGLQRDVEGDDLGDVGRSLVQALSLE